MSEQTTSGESMSVVTGTAPVIADKVSTTWYPDTVKDYVTNKGWKGPEDVLASYQSLEKLIGEDKAGRTFVLPKDDKDLDGIRTMRAKLGVPESPDKYELPAPPGEGGPNLIKEAQSWFHKAGVPKSAAQEIVKSWNEHIESLVKQNEKAAQTESQMQLETLRKEWGNEFEAKAEYARRFLKASGWDDQKMALYESTFGTSDMLKTFYAFGAKFGEPGFASGNETSFAPGKAEVQAKIKELTEQRIAGKISQKEFMTQMAILGPQSEAAA